VSLGILTSYSTLSKYIFGCLFSAWPRNGFLSLSRGGAAAGVAGAVALVLAENYKEIGFNSYPQLNLIATAAVLTSYYVGLAT
jgi:hypothetical protein